MYQFFKIKCPVCCLLQQGAQCCLLMVNMGRDIIRSYLRQYILCMRARILESVSNSI